MPLMKSFSIKKTKPSDLNIDFNTCTIHLLNDNQSSLIVTLKNNQIGTELMEEVCLNIGKLTEKDYFGLRYCDKHGQKYWLKLDKYVLKQLKRVKTNELYFMVKYYPADPLVDLVQDLTRYQFYLQLRRDLYCEHLIVTEELLPKLISLVIQAEIGDMPNPTQESVLSAVNNLKIVKNISESTINKVCQIIVTLKGLESKEVEGKFMQQVSQLESYGVEPNNVLDGDSKKIFLAMNHQGICTFIGEKRTSMYYWENISKMIFVSKMFIFEINTDNKKQKFEFKFNNENAACAFWIWAMDRQYFMTLNTSSEAKKVKSNYNIFRRKVKHRFSGRSKKEVTESCQTLSSIPQPPVIRTRNPVTLSRSNSAKAVFRDSMIVETDDTRANSFSTLPRRSNANKPVSVVSIDFQNSINDCDMVMSSQPGDLNDSINNPKDEAVSESVLMDIDEDQVNEIIEPTESLEIESIFSKIDIPQENGDVKLIENEVRERRIDFSLDMKVNDEAGDGSESSDQLHDCSRYENELHYHHTDGMFFVKFVVITTLILLVVMITSLVAYYYYRSASIADLKKQKYSSEWNKNIDIEAIKRFVLRNDAP